MLLEPLIVNDLVKNILGCTPTEPYPGSYNKQMETQISPKSQGFSLIEVLISLAILAIGLLGVAGLQGGAVQTLIDADLNTTAYILAQDMAGRMRVNPVETAKGANSAYLRGPIDIMHIVNNCLNNWQTPFSVCPPSLMARSDLTAWLTNVQRSLPGGVGTITLINHNPTTYAINISWRTRGGLQRRLVLTFAS